MSRPTWARGLKQFHPARDTKEIPVAPHVGAWIETKFISVVQNSAVRVDRDKKAGNEMANRVDCGVIAITKSGKVLVLVNYDGEFCWLREDGDFQASMAYVIEETRKIAIKRGWKMIAGVPKWLKI